MPLPFAIQDVLEVDRFLQVIGIEGIIHVRIVLRDFHLHDDYRIAKIQGKEEKVRPYNLWKQVCCTIYLHFVHLQ